MTPLNGAALEAAENLLSDKYGHMDGWPHNVAYEAIYAYLAALPMGDLAPCALKPDQRPAETTHPKREG